MAVSNSIDFNITATTLIEDARAELGVQADEEPLENHELERGKRLLNSMLKAWETDGVYAWTYTEGSITLVQSDRDYTFTSGGDFTTVPLDIKQVRITRSGTDLEMYRMSREEYYALPDKTTEGYPTQWYYDRQRDSGTLYVWPAPDSTAGTLKFTYRRRIMDIDAGSDNFDAPVEWLEAIRFGLANRMIGPYGKAGTPEAQRVQAESQRAYNLIKQYDAGEDDSSIIIVPSEHRRR